MTAPGKYETFSVNYCTKSGDPGCVGWPHADHDPPCTYEAFECHVCTECRADDVYGEMCHETTCSQYVQREVAL